MSKIDLHIHTNISDDGEFSPREIIAQCEEQGMNLVAITDHNSVRGVAEAMEAAKNLQVLSGVELDCTYECKNLHLLGYCFDYTRKEFSLLEQDILQQEKTAAEEKVKRFRNYTGIPISFQEVLDVSHNGVVTGELIADLVLAKDTATNYEILKPYLPGGEKSDMPNVRFYWDFFSEGKPAYVPIHYPSLPEAIALIHDAGGIAVLAHPGQTLPDNDALLAHIISENIDGIEVYSSYHNRTACEHYFNVANKNHLFITCGSDFHGKHKPNIKLGGHEATCEDDNQMFHGSHLIS